MKKIFIKGLPYAYTDSDLQTLFADMGQIASAKVIVDRETGQGRGFGFVEMPNDAEADAAMTKLNNSDLDGRTLTVNEARPMEDRGGRRDGGGGGGFRKGGSGGGYNRGGGNRGGRW